MTKGYPALVGVNQWHRGNGMLLACVNCLVGVFMKGICTTDRSNLK